MIVESVTKIQDAAMDLYTALKAFLDYDANANHGVSVIDNTEIWNQAVDAIAKAEGR